MLALLALWVWVHAGMRRSVCPPCACRSPLSAGSRYLSLCVSVCRRHPEMTMLARVSSAYLSLSLSLSLFSVLPPFDRADVGLVLDESSELLIFLFCPRPNLLPGHRQASARSTPDSLLLPPFCGPVQVFGSWENRKTWLRLIFAIDLPVRSPVKSLAVAPLAMTRTGRRTARNDTIASHFQKQVASLRARGLVALSNSNS